MKRTILLTGATGTVSGALLESLKASGSPVQVRALARSEASAAKLRASGIDVVLGDLDEPESLPRAFEGADDLWLLHPPGPRAPENSMNAVWAARRSGVKRIVRMSAIGAAHDAPTRNGRLHALSDAELQASGLRWTILRPHFFMQNFLGVAPLVASQGILPFPLGQGKLGIVDVRDIADVAAAVLLDETSRHDGKIYTPTGPESLTTSAMADQIAGLLGRSVQYVPLSDEAAREAFLAAGFSPWLAGMTLEYGNAYASGWGDFTTTHVKDVTGHDARSFSTFARELWPR